MSTVLSSMTSLPASGRTLQRKQLVMASPVPRWTLLLVHAEALHRQCLSISLVPEPLQQLLRPRSRLRLSSWWRDASCHRPPGWGTVQSVSLCDMLQHISLTARVMHAELKVCDQAHLCGHQSRHLSSFLVSSSSGFCLWTSAAHPDLRENDRTALCQMAASPLPGPTFAAPVTPQVPSGAHMASQAGFRRVSPVRTQTYPAGYTRMLLLTANAVPHLAGARASAFLPSLATVAPYCSTSACCSAWLTGSDSWGAPLGTGWPQGRLNRTFAETASVEASSSSTDLHPADCEHLERTHPEVFQQPQDHWKLSPAEIKLVGYIKWDGEPPPLTIYLRPLLARVQAGSKTKVKDYVGRDPKEVAQDDAGWGDRRGVKTRADQPVKAKSMPKSKGKSMQVTAFPGPGFQTTFLRESDLAEGTVVAVTADTIQVHLTDGSYGELTVPSSFHRAFRKGDAVKQMEVVGLEPEQPILLALSRPALAVDGVDIDLTTTERPEKPGGN
ncbi:unnamed protein product, partial [Symbiodinium sp. CCMP2456]